MNPRRFKTLGMTDEPGHCDLCGTYCPRRRVAVELVEADGSTTGDVQLWGVVCAAEARHGRRDASLARMLRAEAEEAGTYAGAAHGRRRGPRPTVRRSTRRDAATAAARAFADGQAVWLRTAAPVAPELAAAELDGRPWLAAEARYRAAGRRRDAGQAYAHDDGRHAYVDAADPADVARFERAGFRPHAAGSLAQWPELVTV